MEYRAVGNRCMVDFNSMKLPISNENALEILCKNGFRVLEIDIIELARQCISTSQYRRGARFLEAPKIVDCSSFVKWLYAERGIWLPRRSIQQRKIGEVIKFQEFAMGDVVFVSGIINYYDSDPSDGVGHVGIATGEGTVIHAANSKSGVIESPLERFLDGTKFRGARRYIPKDVEVLTLQTPPDREIEIADDIKWIVLQSLLQTKNNHA